MDFEYNYKELSDTESEDDIANMKRRSLIMIEQSLDLPCDVSPLDPRTMREAETQRPGQNIERLLLERVMLRKELRLRGVQELLVETSHKLEVAEKKLAEYESLPGWRAYTAWCALLRVAGEAGSGGAGLVQSGLTAAASALYQLLLLVLGLPCSLFHQLPASLQLVCVTMVAQLASVVGESAENYTNECRETVERGQGERGVVRRRQPRRGSRRS